MNDYEWTPITKDTPLEEVKRIHQLIWDYVIKHGRKPITPYINDCAACEYVYVHIGDPDDRDISYGCEHCPIDWATGICSESISLFGLWHLSVLKGMTNQSSIIAKAIRDIPFKFE